MDRLNSEGIPRDQLGYALRNRKMVMFARQTDTCMLCCRNNVGESGLCSYCYSSLDSPELELAVKWNAGVGP
ncbi:MAG: hypothetical protein ACK53G_12185 [Armatimonadota bacterium]|nr:hypothetical protein [Fimbriimonadaceae bacterium]